MVNKTKKAAGNVKIYWFLVTSLIIIISDHALKYAVKRAEPVAFGFIDIAYTKNYGAGFGILQNKTAVLAWFSVFVIGIIIYYYAKYFDSLNNRASFFVGLLFGGTISNLIDRAFLGFVVDFINFGFWPSFNIADAAITIGIIGIAYYIYRNEKS